MPLPDKAAEVFEQMIDSRTELLGASLAEDRRSLTLQFSSDVFGRFAVQISGESAPPDGSVVAQRAWLKFDYDEPEGAGADPYGRPDPMTHPEAWTE